MTPGTRARNPLGDTQIVAAVAGRFLAAVDALDGPGRNAWRHTSTRAREWYQDEDTTEAVVDAARAAVAHLQAVRHLAEALQWARRACGTRGPEHVASHGHHSIAGLAAATHARADGARATHGPCRVPAVLDAFAGRGSWESAWLAVEGAREELDNQRKRAGTARRHGLDDERRDLERWCRRLCWHATATHLEAALDRGTQEKA